MRNAGIIEYQELQPSHLTIPFNVLGGKLPPPPPAENEEPLPELPSPNGRVRTFSYRFRTPKFSFIILSPSKFASNTQQFNIHTSSKSKQLVNLSYCGEILIPNDPQNWLKLVDFHIKWAGELYTVSKKSLKFVRQDPRLLYYSTKSDFQKGLESHCTINSTSSPKNYLILPGIPTPCTCNGTPGQEGCLDLSFINKVISADSFSERIDTDQICDPRKDIVNAKYKS